MSKTFSRKIDKNFHVSFFSTSFCFIVFSNVSQRVEFKALQKTFCCFARNSCRKVFTKNRQKIQNRIFFLCFVFSRFWAFFGEGSSKTPPEKYRKKTDPGPFLASDPPHPPRESSFLLLPAPCASLVIPTSEDPDSVSKSGLLFAQTC